MAQHSPCHQENLQKGRYTTQRRARRPRAPPPRRPRKVGFQLMLTLSGYNLVRMRNILAEAPT